LVALVHLVVSFVYWIRRSTMPRHVPPSIERRYSLRWLLGIITITCILLAWMRWHGMDWRALRPGTWTWWGIGLSLAAAFVPRNLQASFSVAGTYAFVADATYGMYICRACMHSSDGVVRGKPSFIQSVEQFSVMLAIYPTLAAIPALYFCWRDRRALTLWAARAVIVALANYGLFAYFIWLSIL
jgi:hypothetical protein